MFYEQGRTILIVVARQLTVTSYHTIAISFLFLCIMYMQAEIIM